MTRPKVLYVLHNHPAVRPGGAEVYGLELYEAMREYGDFEPILLARTGPPMSIFDRNHEGTPFAAVNGDPAQYFVFTERSQFDWLFMTSRDKALYTSHFRDFLLAHRPDVIHFQHTLYLGYDMVRAARNVLPDAPIVFTLHEFGAICHRSGQMVRTGSDELCLEESPRRCHECFPEVTPQTFFLRKRFIQSHLSLVDMFLAPSQFLRDRHLEWGIPPEKMRFEEYGRLPAMPLPDRDGERPRNRLAFFGQFLPFKGVHILLRAMKILSERGHDAHLRLYGANLELQPADFQEEFRRLVAQCASNVSLVGRYDHAELPMLMAQNDWVVVPSIWWENSPLVIQEAFAHGRPVICSDIGGMAEQVTDGVNGLHFRVGDPVSLAETIRGATASPELWRRLRAGIPELYSMERHVGALSQLYHEQLEARTLEVLS